jgi:hypothetical protein
MPLNYPPIVVLTTEFRRTGGHDLNPTAQLLRAEDQQLFSTFNQPALQVMAQAGLDTALLPVVVTLASIAPGVSPTQRVQLAVLFVKNATAALNSPSPLLGAVMLGAARNARAGSRKRAVTAAKRTAAARKKSKTPGRKRSRR